MPGPQMLPNDANLSPEQRAAAAVVAFRRRYAMTVERLAGLLALDPSLLREYEAGGTAPRWLFYALVGVEYQEFGAVAEPAVDGRARGTCDGAEAGRVPARAMDGARPESARSVGPPSPVGTQSAA